MRTRVASQKGRGSAPIMLLQTSRNRADSRRAPSLTALASGQSRPPPDRQEHGSCWPCWKATGWPIQMDMSILNNNYNKPPSTASPAGPIQEKTNVPSSRQPHFLENPGLEKTTLRINWINPFPN